MNVRAVFLAAVLALAPCAAFGQAQPVQGTGTAGNPAGGVLTVQGPAGGGGTPSTVTPVPTAGSGAYSAATVGTTDSTILTASTAVHFLDLVNASASATICINLGATATISGTQCAAGEIPLPPLWHRSWENNFVPTDAVHAIASAASTQATVGAK